MLSPKPMAIILTAASCWALAGCGSSDRDQVRQTVQRFSAATAKHDYATLCKRVFAPSLLSRLQAIGLPCEQALRRYLGPVKAPKLMIAAETLSKGHATVVVRSSAAGQASSTDVLELVKSKDGWRIASRSAAQQQRHKR